MTEAALNRPEATTAQGLPELQIVAYPKMAVLPVGTLVRFEVQTKDGSPLPEGLRYMWQCLNDPESVARGTRSRFRGPFQPTWDNARWNVAGRHTIMLTVSNPATGDVRRIQLSQRVDYAANILGAELNEALDEDAVTPFQYLLQVEQYRDTLVAIAEASPPTDYHAEDHLNRVAELDDLLAQLRRLTQGLAEREGYPVRAMHIDEETGTRTPLRLWLCNLTGNDQRRRLWRLIDWTNPSYRQATGVYESGSREDGTAIEQVFARWDSGNRYPKGRLHYQVDLNLRQLSFDDGFDTSGRNFWDTVANWLGYTALAAGLIALAVAPIPGSRIASVAIYTSIVTSTGSAMIHIAHRHADGFGNGRDDLFDGLTIIGNLFAVGTLWRMGATVTSGTRLGSGMTQATLIGQIGTDGLQGILLGAEYVQQYKDIMEAPYLSPEERLQRLLALFSTAAVTGALTYISVQSSAHDISQINRRSGQDLMSPDTQIDLDATPPPSTPIARGQTELHVTVDYQVRHHANQGPARTLSSGQLARVSRQFENPNTFKEARDLLDDARRRLDAGGSPLKYSDDELLELVRHSNTLNDNYTVRFMEEQWVYGPSIDKSQKLGGLGRPHPDTNQVKYWSSTFDQIVDSDSDPELIRRTLGVTDQYFNPGQKYVMVLIDQRKYRSLGTETFIPTYDNMANYIIRSGSNMTPKKASLVRRVLSDEYTKGPRSGTGKHSYRELMDEVESRNIDLTDEDVRRTFLSSKFGDDAVEKRLFNTRHQLEMEYGIFSVFEGNGLTKSLHPGSQQYAALETMTVESSPNILEDMINNGVIDIIDLKPR